MYGLIFACGHAGITFAWCAGCCTQGHLSSQSPLSWFENGGRGSTTKRGGAIYGSSKCCKAAVVDVGSMVDKACSQPTMYLQCGLCRCTCLQGQPCEGKRSSSRLLTTSWAMASCMLLQLLTAPTCLCCPPCMQEVLMASHNLQSSFFQALQHAVVLVGQEEDWARIHHQNLVCQVSTAAV